MTFHQLLLALFTAALLSCTGLAQQIPATAQETAAPIANTGGEPSASSDSPSEQVAASSSVKSLEKDFLKNLLSDQKAIIISPLKIKPADAKLLIPFLAGTAALFATDRRISREISDSRDIRNVSRNISYLGTAYSTLGISGGLYFLGKASGNERLQETGLLSLQAVTNSLILVGGIKLATNRKRPLDGGGGRFYNGGKSFASGHAVGSWALATVVAEQYSDRPLIQIAAYGAAALVSASRVTGKNHFASDVLVGATFGYLIGRFTARRHRVSNGVGPAPVAVLPYFNPSARSYGLSVSAQW